ncbi:MAG TPA: hypothetical protein VFL47_08635, partial [Flavisolibacter sp.]|nr:hypothetical protein [Flavisolibacter sp.]
GKALFGGLYFFPGKNAPAGADTNFISFASLSFLKACVPLLVAMICSSVVITIMVTAKENRIKIAN